MVMVGRSRGGDIDVLRWAGPPLNEKPPQDIKNFTKGKCSLSHTSGCLISLSGSYGQQYH